MELFCHLESPLWAEVPIEAVLHRVVPLVLAECGVEAEGVEIAVMATDDDGIARLNAEFRGKPTPTNVLSWPVQDLGPGKPGARPCTPKADAFGDLPLGDVALAFQTCAREAAEQGKPLEAHLTHLIVHGVLHLLGYDHIDDADAALMERCEVEILGKLGIADPYRVA